MLARDHYATLGIAPSADQEQIEQAYRHLSRRYHPDINPGDAHAAVVFERIEDAYQILSDPQRRDRYDREGSLSERLDGDAGDLSVRVLPESEGGSYAELFRQLRGQAARGVPVPGDDIHATASIPLRLAGRGKRATVEVHRRDDCHQCGGRGRVQLQRSRPCERCNGVGRETFVKGALSVACVCSDCDGAGIRSGVACPDCDGTGLRLQPTTVLVRIPPGVQDGQAIRVAAGGHAGQRGGERGDLVVRCQVERVEGFEREGPHLRVRHAISVGEALLGAKLEISTLEGGRATLRIPPATQTGRTFRLRGQGLKLSDGRRGDMLVQVAIHIPETIDENSKQLIREFTARNPYPCTRTRTSGSKS